ncbi:hypothetical protein [Candidatus Harpocratesius sp.]
MVTKKKHYRFYLRFVDTAESKTLEKVYNIRTRIEEHYNLNETVYNSAHLHCCGEILTKMEILLLNCLGVLVPLTAYKIGRPDLMWCPTLFCSHKIHPERIFPRHYEELEQIRWDNEIVTSPRRYKRELTEFKASFQKKE